MNKNDYTINKGFFETTIHYKDGEIVATPLLQFTFNTSSLAGIFIYSQCSRIWQDKGTGKYDGLSFTEKRTGDIEKDAQNIAWYIKNKAPYL